MNSLMSKQDVEFIDYYERLCQCIVFELADEDWDWFELIINNYVVNGHLKRVVSCQASILELPHGLQSNFMMAHFLKSIKLQISYAHYFRTIDCNRVQSLDYMICVEVEQGEVRPCKNTNLHQEVLSIQLPPTQAGGQVLSNAFIDGAHMVLAGPARGHLHLPHQNSEVNEQFVSYFAKCLCAHMYQYLQKRSTSHAGVVRQFSVPGMKPRRDSEQWIPARIRPCIEQLLFSVFLTKPTYKIWPSWP